MVLIHYSKENPEIFEQEASQSRLTRKRRYGSKEDDVFHLIKDCENCKVSQERKDIIKRIEELIKSKDFNINHQDGDGDTFLHAAIIANLPDVANLFLAKGINVALSNKEDKTPYQLAKEKFHTDPQWSTVVETLKKLSEADQSKDPLSPDGQQVLENNNLNLPEGFQVGKAIGEGDCFFDTVTQGLRQLKPEKEFSVKSLRKVCKEFAQSQLSIDESWLKGNLEGENEKLNEYILRVEFTVDDIKQKLEEVILLGLTSAIWGRPEIEGRIICAKYNVKIYVIEKQVVEGETIWINQLVDSKGSKSVEDIDYNKENAIYIVNQGRLHFEPVLRKQLSFIEIPKPGSNDISQPKPTATNRVVKWLGKEGEYTEEQIRENPNLLFLFGDNDEAKYRTNKNNPGGDGQAKATRPAEGLPYDRLVDSEKQTRKRPPTGDQLENRDLKRQKLIQPSWRSNPTHTSGELKRSLHGNNYQLELLILFAWQYKGYVAFRLGTEVAEAGKFDDLVLRYGDDQDRTYRFLQAKHTQHLTEKSNIQYEEFFEVNGDFSLKKYFLSYLDKKNGEKFQDGSIRDVILCTNRNLEENIKDYFEEITAQDEVLDLGGKRYRFSKDQAKRNDVIQKLSRVLNKNTRSGDLTKHTDKTISEFLDQLVLAVGQLSGPNLSNIIKTEIGDEFNLTPVNNVIYTAFYKYMSEWMEHRVKDGAGPGSAHFMEHDDLKGFVNDAKIKIAEIVSIGPTSLRRREIEELNIAFKDGTTLKALRDFLTPYNKKQIFNLATKNTLLSTVKVDSVLRSMLLYNEKEDSHIFLRLSTLLILQERFIKAFTSPTDNLLVIECDPISEDREGLYDKLSRIVRDKSNKKVILITKEGNDLASKFKQEFSQLDKYEEKRDDENGFKNLNAGSQQKLLSKNVIFQGKDKRLGELLDSESLKKVVGPNELVELITSDEIKIGGEVDEFSYVPNENLGRELKLNKVSVKVLGEDEGAFILECEKAKKDLESLQGELRTKYGNEQIFVLDTSSAKKKFQKLADKKDSGNIYLLKGQFSELKESKDAKLELKESHGVLNKLRNHIVVDRDVVDNLSEVFVIHGETGIGKTVFLNELCHKHSQSSWVIYVDLFHSSHGIWFSKDFSGDANINSFIKVLKELKKLNSKFEESLFRLALKGEDIKLMIFFDSFDLLGADSQKAILSLLKTLKGHTGLKRLGIAVRSYDKHKVEDDLSLLAYELPRLGRVDQDTVLNHFIGLYGKKSEGNSIRESVDRYRKQGGDTSLPITLEILPNIPMSNSDESLDMTQLCQKQLEELLLKFANSGGVQSGVSEKLKAHISSLALSQSFGKARASVDKEFIGFAGRYVGIGGIFDSSRDTNSPVLRSFFAEFLSRKHPAIQSIIEKRRNNGFNLNDIDQANDIVKENYYTDVARPLRKYVDWQSVKDRDNPIYKYMMDIIENKRQVDEFKVILEHLKDKYKDKYYEFIKEKGVLPFTSNHDYNIPGLVCYLIDEILSEGLEKLDRSKGHSGGKWFGKYFSFINVKKDDISRSKNHYYNYLSFRMQYIRERSEFKDALIYFAKLGNIQVVDQLFSTRLWIYYASSSGSPQILLTPENLSTGSGILLVEKDGSLINDVIQNIEQRNNLLSISVEKKLYHLSVAAMRTDSGKQEIADDKGGKILCNTIYHKMVIVRDRLRNLYREHQGILNELGSDGKAFVHRFLECHYRGKIKTYLQKVERCGGDIDISVLDSSGRTIELIAASGKSYRGAFFAILKAFPKQRPKLLESSLTAVEKIEGTQNKLTALENLLEFRRTIFEKARTQEEKEPYVNDNNLRIIQRIAELYKQDKNCEKALEWFQELHEMKERSLGSKHEQVLWIGLEIVSILRKQEKYDEALEHLEGLLNLIRGELNIDENDYFFNSILLSAEYEKAMIELTQDSYPIVFDKLEEVLNGVITQLDDGGVLSVFQREQLSELKDKLELVIDNHLLVSKNGLLAQISRLLQYTNQCSSGREEGETFLCVDSNSEEPQTKRRKELIQKLSSLSEEGVPLENVDQSSFQRPVAEGSIIAGKIGKVAEIENNALAASFVIKHLANQDGEGLSYDALNLLVLPKIGEALSEEILKLDLSKVFAPLAKHSITNLLAFIGLEESIKAQKNAKDPETIKAADLSIASNSIFIIANITPDMITELMEIAGKKTGLIGEFAKSIGNFIAVNSIVIPQFIQSGLVEKLKELISHTNFENHSNSPQNQSMTFLERIEKEYRIWNNKNYSIIAMDLSESIEIREKVIVSGWSSKKTTRFNASQNSQGIRIVVDSQYPQSNVSRLINAFEGYETVCGPQNEENTIKNSTLSVPFKGVEFPSKISKTEEREISFGAFPLQCQNSVIYKKTGPITHPRAVFLLSGRWSNVIKNINTCFDLYVFAGDIFVTSNFTLNEEEPQCVNNYFFNEVADSKNFKCTVSNSETNVFYIKGTGEFFCSLIGEGKQNNIVVLTQGDFVDFENIDFVIGSNTSNLIEVSHASYVDGRGGSDLIIAKNNSTVIQGHFGDHIYGNGQVLLPMNFNDIDRITYANNRINISDKDERFTSIDKQTLIKTADGFFITPIKIDNETNVVQNLLVSKNVNNNITLENGLSDLREVENPNFNLTKQLLNTNYVIVTFDQKKHYKLQDGKLEHDYCTHDLEIDGTYTINYPDLLNYNCLVFNSSEISFSRKGNDLVLQSGKEKLLILGYYSRSFENQGNLSIKLNNSIIKPEEFKMKADGKFAFRVYEPGERELKIYHNQPINRAYIGIIDLQDKSLLDFDMRIVNDSLILSSRNNTVVRVENYNTYQPAREMIFAFNDTTLFNSKCIVSDCDPKDIIEEFGKETVKLISKKDEGGNTLLHHATMKGELDKVRLLVEKGAEDNKQRHRRHHIRHENHHSGHRSPIQEVASSGTRPSSWINDLFGWVKDSVGRLLGSQVALPGTQSLPKESTSNSKPKVATLKADLSQVDVNGTILLLDTFIRKFTG